MMRAPRRDLGEGWFWGGREANGGLPRQSQNAGGRAGLDLGASIDANTGSLTASRVFWADAAQNDAMTGPAKSSVRLGWIGEIFVWLKTGNQWFRPNLARLVLRLALGFRGFTSPSTRPHTP